MGRDSEQLKGVSKAMADDLVWNQALCNDPNCSICNATSINPSSNAPSVNKNSVPCNNCGGGGWQFAFGNAFPCQRCGGKGRIAIATSPTKYFDVQVTGCVHEWKEYVGFTQKYKYCTKCDEKDKT